MGGAAVRALYTKQPLPRVARYEDLRNVDIKRLARIFSYHPAPHIPHLSPQIRIYEDFTKKQIGKLGVHLLSPAYDSTVALLRQTTKQLMHTPGKRAKQGELCPRLHDQLNQPLVYSIWESLRLELANGILPALERLREVQMLSQDMLDIFDCLFWVQDMWSAVALPNVPEHLLLGPNKVSKWVRQFDGCPGCMLARIGGDNNIVFALRAMFVAHWKLEKLTAVGSARMLWVENWLQLEPDGKEYKRLLAQSWEIGREIRRLLREEKIQRHANDEAKKQKEQRINAMQREPLRDDASLLNRSRRPSSGQGVQQHEEETAFPSSEMNRAKPNHQGNRPIVLNSPARSGPSVPSTGERRRRIVQEELRNLPHRRRNQHYSASIYSQPSLFSARCETVNLNSFSPSVGRSSTGAHVGSNNSPSPEELLHSRNRSKRQMMESETGMNIEDYRKTVDTWEGEWTEERKDPRRESRTRPSVSGIRSAPRERADTSAIANLYARGYLTEAGSGPSSWIENEQKRSGSGAGRAEGAGGAGRA